MQQDVKFIRVKYFGILFIVMIFLLGCTSKNTKPFVVPTSTEMASILADVHVTEALLTENSSIYLLADQPGGFNYTLKKYGLNKEGFDSAVAYYSAQPVVYQQIYEDVLAILTEKEMSARALKDDSIKTNKLTNDSIEITNKSIWKKNRFFEINSQDSSILNASFNFKLDSILGGDIVFVSKYKFRSKEVVDAKYSSRIFANYADGTKDSSEVIIAYSRISKEYTMKISLKKLLVKEVGGTLIISESTKPFRVEASDIQLDWKETLSKVE